MDAKADEKAVNIAEMEGCYSQPYPPAERDMMDDLELCLDDIKIHVALDEDWKKFLSTPELGRAMRCKEICKKCHEEIYRDGWTDLDDKKWEQWRRVDCPETEEYRQDCEPYYLPPITEPPMPCCKYKAEHLKWVQSGIDTEKSTKEV